MQTDMHGVNLVEGSPVMIVGGYNGKPVTYYGTVETQHVGKASRKTRVTVHYMVNRNHDDETFLRRKDGTMTVGPGKLIVMDITTFARFESWEDVLGDDNYAYIGGAS